MQDTDNTYINLATWTENGTEALGPGKRLALWVQGCLKNCPGCVSPSFKPLRIEQLVEIHQLVAYLCSRTEFEGVTISGGEPFLQAAALSRLIQQVREIRPELNVIVFTGFTYEELIWEEAQCFLKQIDLLIDGPYRQESFCEEGLRGSQNQRFIYLTERLRSKQEEIEHGVRIREIQYINQSIFPIGIPPKAGILGDLFKKLYIP